MEKNKKAPPRPLTLKQRRFVEAYVSGGCKNAKQAAIAAGYSRKGIDSTASSLLRNSKVKAEIDKCFKPLREKTLIDADYVIQGLVKVFETCSTRIPKVTFDGDQLRDEQGRPAWRLIDAAGANAALKSLAQALGVGQLAEDKDSTIASLAKSLQKALDGSSV